jgi:hypothetical protein
MAAENTEIDLSLPGAEGEGVSLTITVPDEDGEFEDALLNLIKSRTIDPMNGIDMLVEDTTLLSVVREEDGSYRLEMVFEQDGQ